MKNILSHFASPGLLVTLSIVAIGISTGSFFLFLLGKPADQAGLMLSVSALVLTYLILFASTLRLLDITLWGKRIPQPPAGGWLSHLLPLLAVLLLLISQETSHQLSGLLWMHAAVDPFFSLIPLISLVILTLFWMVHRLWRIFFAIPMVACALFLPPTLTFTSEVIVDTAVRGMCAQNTPPGFSDQDCYAMKIDLDEHITRRASPIARFF